VKKPHNLPTNISKSLFKNDFFVLLTMQHIQGISPNQLQMSSLENKISNDNLVRFIDAFVSFIDLKKVGFELKILNHNTLAVAKIQVLVKANFVCKGFCVQK
jgi:recombinational DNA repair protein RecR